MNQCKALNFQIAEEQPVNAELDFQGEIIQGSGGIQYETDPTVPAWAKEPNKPSYTAEEVGAVPTIRKIADIDLLNDISAIDLQENLSVYPTIQMSQPPQMNTQGKIGQLAIYYYSKYIKELYYCKDIVDNNGTIFYKWEKIGKAYNLEWYSGGNVEQYLTNLYDRDLGSMIYAERTGNIYVCIDNEEKGVWQQLLGKHHIITEINENNTDAQIPSAKLFYNTVDNLQNSLQNKATKEYVDELFSSIVNGSEVSW